MAFTFDQWQMTNGDRNPLIYSEALNNPNPVDEEIRNYSFIVKDCLTRLAEIDDFGGFINLVNSIVEEAGGILYEIHFYPYLMRVAYTLPEDSYNTVNFVISQETSDYYKEHTQLISPRMNLWWSLTEEDYLPPELEWDGE